MSEKIDDTQGFHDRDTIGLLLYNIGRYPLLTLEQEQKYTRIVFDYLQDPEGSGISEVRYQKARQLLLNCNLRLVVSTVKHFSRKDPDVFLSFFQEGSIGLARALDKFDPYKGYKFSTYATWWIRQAITRFRKNHCSTIRVPIHVAEKRFTITKTRAIFYAEHGRMPTVEELAEILEQPCEKVLNLLRVTQPSISIDRPIDPDEPSETIANFYPSDLDSPESLVDRDLAADYIAKYLSVLNEKERYVIAEQYGLIDGKPKPYARIADTMGLCRERVRQLANAAMLKLRKKARNDRNDWF